MGKVQEKKSTLFSLSENKLVKNLTLNSYKNKMRSIKNFFEKWKKKL